MSKKGRRGRAGTRRTSDGAGEPGRAEQTGLPPSRRPSRRRADGHAAEPDAAAADVRGPRGRAAEPASDEGRPRSQGPSRRSPEPPPMDVPATAGSDSSYPPVDLDDALLRGTRRADGGIAARARGARSAHGAQADAGGGARRRADLQKYVKFAVAGASVLCLAALVKVGMTRSHAAEGTRRPAVAAAAAPRRSRRRPCRRRPRRPRRPRLPRRRRRRPRLLPRRPRRRRPRRRGSAGGDRARPAAASPRRRPPGGERRGRARRPPRSPTRRPRRRRRTPRQAALERGKNAEAIEAGERSVALDPTDGEAWLILGAAYQAKGDMKNARRSYKACLEQGKRGPEGRVRARCRTDAARAERDAPLR